MIRQKLCQDPRKENHKQENEHVVHKSWGRDELSFSKQRREGNMVRVWKGLNCKRYLYKGDIWWRKGQGILWKEMLLFIFQVFICNYSLLNTLLKCDHLRSLQKGTSATLFPASFVFTAFITTWLPCFFSSLTRVQTSGRQGLYLIPCFIPVATITKMNHTWPLTTRAPSLVSDRTNK